MKINIMLSVFAGIFFAQSASADLTMEPRPCYQPQPRASNELFSLKVDSKEVAKGSRGIIVCYSSGEVTDYGAGANESDARDALKRSALERARFPSELEIVCKEVE